MAFASSSSSSSIMRSARQLARSGPAKPSRSLARSSIVPPPAASRPYSAAAAAYAEPSSSHIPSQSQPQAQAQSSLPPQSQPQTPNRRRNTSNYTRPSERSITPEEAQSFLSNLLGLPSDRQFSPELALQILTHKSYRYSHSVRHFNDASSASGLGLGLRSNEPHNSRLSFLGRRALQTYLSLFIHDSFSSTSTSTSTSNSDSATSGPRESLRTNAVDFLRGSSLEDRLDNLRDTRNLGRLVAPHWGVSDVTRWDRNETSRESGDLKILGMTIESILGGVFTEFGSPAAQRTFHSMILPHYIPQLKDPRLIERVLGLKDQVQSTSQGILRV
ncbi:mitochondrial 54S ribosomal protein mL57 [Kwoniella dejecticola CBS 10117]|uniref:RNase III domain-containing protein n=1 Tax=Kwoniella dejecticola CBS 10117 TaxID=1296121 RepID=A0A1A5ZWY7_9TREE|nr:uncharacterized protein I303_07085 [Kwoniella dejecticola CBS 10117]OBR82326.1 hypothetical protein I303_07085 [Kwoniella dejecticola CBS 10117]